MVTYNQIKSLHYAKQALVFRCGLLKKKLTLFIL